MDTPSPALAPLGPGPRRKGPRISVWLLPDEKAAIQGKAKAHSMSDSAYLRALGLDFPVKSTLDQEAIMELAKVNGDLGRLGGLLKLWLTNRDRAINEERVRSLMGQLERTQALLLTKVESLAAKP